MRTMLKKAIRDESGKILILVLVLLVVGGLLLGPLLGLMSTGLASGQVYEKKASELYAADAGVEAAVWGIQTKNLIFNDDRVSLDPVTVNGKTVRVEIEREDLGITQCRTLRQYRYYILSEAFDDDGATTINAVLSATYTLPPDFSGLLKYAISSNGTITIQAGTPPGSQVIGDIYIADDAGLTNNGYHDGRVDTQDDVVMTWPTFGQLSAYYGEQVENSQYYPSHDYTMTIPRGTTKDSPYVIESLLAAGHLTIKGRGYIRIGGTIYVKGDLILNATPSIHVDLNGQTIFVEGEIYVPPQVTFAGSGCIIAKDQVWFQPIMESDPGDFIFVMSIHDQVWFNPGDDFTGSVAGSAHVQLQPNNRITWIDPPEGLNFPLGDDGGSYDGDPDKLPINALSIESWQIQQGGQ